MRNRVLVELGVLSAATALFLLSFPDRPNRVEVSLALLALVMLAANAGYTRRVVWSAHPPARGGPDRAGSWRAVSAFTLVALLALAALGASDAWRAGGGDALRARLLDARPLAVAALYLPWALLQQTLFQFYLLGRLLALTPGRNPAPAIVVTGLCYALVHLPDVGLAAVTAASGVFWTFCYYRYRVLLSIAASHALLGSAFYAWLYQRDMLSGALRLLRSWL